MSHPPSSYREVSTVPPLLSLPTEFHDCPKPANTVSTHTGSGKSSLAHAITATHPQFTRLSIDGINYEKNGRYGVDYDASLYTQYMDEAAEVYEVRLRELLKGRQDVVLDRAFYARADRDEFKRLVEERGGRWVLAVFKVKDKEVLWTRVQGRKVQRGTLGGEREGDAAFEITRELFEGWWDGFEWPVGEGEWVVEVE